MRRHTRALVLVVLTTLAASWYGSATTAEDDQERKNVTSPAQHPLVGAWRIVSKTVNGEVRKVPPGIEMVKFVSGGRFIWSASQEGKILATVGGRYTIRGDRYVETIEFADDKQQARIGTSIEFEWSVKDGVWHHVAAGKDSTIDELWERCEK